jgi:hypothetical protein
MPHAHKSERAGELRVIHNERAVGPRDGRSLGEGLLVGIALLLTILYTSILYSEWRDLYNTSPSTRHYEKMWPADNQY